MKIRWVGSNVDEVRYIRSVSYPTNKIVRSKEVRNIPKCHMRSDGINIRRLDSEVRLPQNK